MTSMHACMHACVIEYRGALVHACRQTVIMALLHGRVRQSGCGVGLSCWQSAWIRMTGTTLRLLSCRSAGS